METFSLFGIFIASLLGSPHCGGMCGGFVALYSASVKSSVAHALYHGGRLLTYLCLGGIAGIIGSRFDAAGELVGIHRIALITISLLILLWSLLLFHSGTRRTHFNRVAYPLTRLVVVPLKRTIALGREKLGVAFPLILGLTSTLLPCGWLYLFLGIAATKASIFGGLAVMTVFWLGTLPMLVTIGKASQSVLLRFRDKAPRIIATLVFCSSVLSLYSHFESQLHDHSGSTHSGSHEGHHTSCHTE